MNKFTYISFICLVLAQITTLTGCKNDTTIEQLRAENPFKRPDQKKEVVKRPLISCLSLKMVVPESLGVDKLAIFKDHALTNTTAGPGNTLNLLDPSQIEAWQRNGFIIALAPIAMQNQTIETLKRYFAEENPTPWLNIYKEKKEFSDMPLAEIGQEKELSIVDYAGNEKKYTLAPGEFLLRFHSTISSPQQMNTKTVNFFIIPVFRDFTPKKTIISGIVTPESLPVTGFEELIFSGTVGNGQTLAISCSQKAIDEKLPAAQMLYDSEMRSVAVILLSPAAEMVE